MKEKKMNPASFCKNDVFRSVLMLNVFIYLFKRLSK